MTTTTDKTKTWLWNEVKARPEFLKPLEVPLRYQQANLANVPQPGLVKAAKRYGAEFWNAAPQGLAPFFVGDASTYKTYTAAVIALAIRNVMLIDVAWCNCPSEIGRLDRENFLESARDRIEYLKRVPFLILDDFTQLKGNSRQLDILVEIGTMRFDAMRPTLYTGNITITKDNREELIAAVGACLSRRILDGSEGFRAMTRSR